MGSSVPNRRPSNKKPPARISMEDSRGRVKQWVVCGSVENPTSAKGTGTFSLRGLRKNEPVPGGVFDRAVVGQFDLRNNVATAVPSRFRHLRCCQRLRTAAAALGPTHYQAMLRPFRRRQPKSAIISDRADSPLPATAGGRVSDENQQSPAAPCRACGRRRKRWQFSFCRRRFLWPAP
jgi:hypothetical protein